MKTASKAKHITVGGAVVCAGSASARTSTCRCSTTTTAPLMRTLWRRQWSDARRLRTTGCGWGAENTHLSFTATCLVVFFHSQSMPSPRDALCVMMRKPRRSPQQTSIKGEPHQVHETLLLSPLSCLRLSFTSTCLHKRTRPFDGLFAVPKQHSSLPSCGSQPILDDDRDTCTRVATDAPRSQLQTSEPHQARKELQKNLVICAFMNGVMRWSPTALLSFDVGDGPLQRVRMCPLGAYEVGCLPVRAMAALKT